MDEFKSLWREFVLGTRSLIYHRQKGGRTPFYAKELERFNIKIVDPMNASWSRLTPSERAQFELEEPVMKW